MVAQLTLLVSADEADAPPGVTRSDGTRTRMKAKKARNERMLRQGAVRETDKALSTVVTRMTTELKLQEGAEEELDWVGDAEEDLQEMQSQILIHTRAL